MCHYHVQDGLASLIQLKKLVRPTVFADRLAFTVKCL
jgi:hypothetical protein